MYNDLNGIYITVRIPLKILFEVFSIVIFTSIPGRLLYTRYNIPYTSFSTRYYFGYIYSYIICKKQQSWWHHRPTSGLWDTPQQTPKPLTWPTGLLLLWSLRAREGGHSWLLYSLRCQHCIASSPGLRRRRGVGKSVPGRRDTLVGLPANTGSCFSNTTRWIPGISRYGISWGNFPLQSCWGLSCDPGLHSQGDEWMSEQLHQEYHKESSRLQVLHLVCQYSEAYSYAYKNSHQQYCSSNGGAALYRTIIRSLGWALVTVKSSRATLVVFEAMYG